MVTTPLNLGRVTGRMHGWGSLGTLRYLKWLTGTARVR